MTLDRFLLALGLAVVLLFVRPSLAQPRIAVASNFYNTAESLARDFSSRGGVKPVLLNGSTGKHVAQIIQGMPIDLLLAADQKRPARLEELGLVKARSRSAYAVGRLVFWKPASKNTLGEHSSLASALHGVKTIAIANPVHAPYGTASNQVLKQSAKGMQSSRVVMGENIAQTFQFIYTGNAEGGFIAKSQSLNLPPEQLWEVPATKHEPIIQQMVLLSDDRAARDFYDFVLSDRGQSIIRDHGYELPND